MIAAWLLLGAAACSGRGAGIGAPADGLSPGDLNVILITLDTTRADRIGCYGYRDIATPHLDALAARGTLFEQAHATAPLTLPSHCSIFTGKYPPAHGVRDNGGYVLREDETTLAETLKSAGWSTAGFVSAFVLDRRWGAAQGFDHYFDDFDLTRYTAVGMGDIQRPGSEMLEPALAWLRDNRAKKLFAWLHFYDPHAPYEPPEPYRTIYAGRQYVGEIAYVDALIGQLTDEISRLGLAGRTLLVVTGDHGESLGEHRESAHAFFVYSATTHVPLILSGGYPGLAGRRIAEVVRTIDIMPTVLDLLGLPHDGIGQGLSLVPILAGREEAGRAAYSESFYARNHFGWSDLRTLRDGPWRFIEAPQPELYDVGIDPGELENLASAQPLVLESLRERLAAIEQETGSPVEAAAPEEMDAETQKRLAALGYIGSTVDTAGRPSAELPDPKEKIGLVNRLHAAREEALAGRRAEAIAQLESVLAESPEIIDGWFRLGSLRLQEGQLTQAAKSFQTTLSLKPDHEWAVVGLADTYVEMGRLEDALVGYRQHLAREPNNDTVAYRLAETLMDAGRLTEAQRGFERVLAIKPQRAAAAVGISAVAFKRGDVVGARAAARRALAIDPNARSAWFNLALCSEQAGETAEALGSYRREIAIHPHSQRARFNMARLLGRAGDAAGQIRELRAMVDDAPDVSFGRFYLAKALLDAGDIPAASDEARRALQIDPEGYYAPLGHYVLADALSRRGEKEAAEEEARIGHSLEARNLPPPPH